MRPTVVSGRPLKRVPAKPPPRRCACSVPGRSHVHVYATRPGPEGPGVVRLLSGDVGPPYPSWWTVARACAVPVLLTAGLLAFVAVGTWVERALGWTP